MNGNEKKIKNKRAAKLGSVTLIGAAIVLAVVIIVNVAVNLLPSRFTKYNLSKNGVYDISDATRELVAGISDKVNIYVVSESAATDKVTLEYAKRLADLNPNIICEQVDPNIKPGFIGNYTEETLESSDTNIIVANASNGRSKVIKQSEIYYRQYSEQEVAFYAYYYNQQVDNPTYFDAENCLATAIDYVTTDKLPTVYYTSGHGETALDVTVTKLISAENIVLRELPTLTADKMPEDADVIILNSPTLDLTADETSVLSGFVDKGGNVILVTNLGGNYSTLELPNVYGFTRSLGLDYGYSLVCEGSESHYYRIPPCVYAQVAENEFSSSLQQNVRVIVLAAHEILKTEETPEGVTVSELLTTSVQGYVKDLSKYFGETVNDPEGGEQTRPQLNNYEKESGDREGKIITGAMSKKGDGALLWFSTDTILDGSTVGYYANVPYMLSVISKLSGKTTVATASAKALQVQALQVTEGSANIWGTIIIGIVPVILIAVGLIVWYRRKVR